MRPIEEQVNVYPRTQPSYHLKLKLKGFFFKIGSHEVPTFELGEQENSIFLRQDIVEKDIMKMPNSMVNAFNILYIIKLCAV